MIQGKIKTLIPLLKKIATDISNENYIDFINYGESNTQENIANPKNLITSFNSDNEEVLFLSYRK